MTERLHPGENGVWHWEPQPEAQRLIDDLLGTFLGRNSFAATLAQRMTEETGTRFKDWVDSIFVPGSDRANVDRAVAVGFEPDPDARLGHGVSAVYRNPFGLFPPICLIDEDKINVAIKCEDVGDALFAQRLQSEVIGGPLNQVRWARLDPGRDAELWAVERHGYDHFDQPDTPAETRLAARGIVEALRTRRRDFGVGLDADARGFAEIHRILDASIDAVGRDWTADLWFRAERDYWMSRNRAARVQWSRQQVLGLGFANHDHHTYRISRDNYAQTIAILEKLGFFLREKFYAGAEAGWGAQVLEHPVGGFQIFADVDMKPDELAGDFPHEGFPPKDDLGTVGLWVALHGEAILQAGMHHLECQFDWHALKAQLQRDANIGMMDPFTTFPYLRQAFTDGEQWRVDGARIDALQATGKITPDEAARFHADGARGSHLENLERNDGFKGFNQQGVSDIIARTDARRA